eukprot:m51a1_g2719 hypothetical protein (473) ;mRNA; f:849352-850910
MATAAQQQQRRPRSAEAAAEDLTGALPDDVVQQVLSLSLRQSVASHYDWSQPSRVPCALVGSLAVYVVRGGASLWPADPPAAVDPALWGPHTLALSCVDELALRLVAACRPTLRSLSAFAAVAGAALATCPGLAVLQCPLDVPVFEGFAARAAAGLPPLASLSGTLYDARLPPRDSPAGAMIAASLTRVSLAEVSARSLRSLCELGCTALAEVAACGFTVIPEDTEGHRRCLRRSYDDARALAEGLPPLRSLQLSLAESLAESCTLRAVAAVGKQARALRSLEWSGSGHTLRGLEDRIIGPALAQFAALEELVLVDRGLGWSTCEAILGLAPHLRRLEVAAAAPAEAFAEALAQCTRLESLELVACPHSSAFLRAAVAPLRGLARLCVRDHNYFESRPSVGVAWIDPFLAQVAASSEWLPALRRLVIEDVGMRSTEALVRARPFLLLQNYNGSFRCRCSRSRIAEDDRNDAE